MEHIMTINYTEIDLLSSTASDYTVELKIDDKLYNHFYSHKRKQIKLHLGSIATAFKLYLQKKIPKLLLKHDKEYSKYDLYYLKNRNIHKYASYREKDARDKFDELRELKDKEGTPVIKYMIICLMGKVIDK